MKLAEEGIFVIENCIHPSLQDAIEKYYFSEKYVFNYVWSKKTDASLIKIENGILANPVEYNFLLPIIQSSLNQIDLTYDFGKIILARTLMQNSTENSIKNGVHVDTGKKCYSAVYYVNDSDGDTLFFDKTTKDFTFDEYEKMRFEENWKEKQEEIFTKIVFRKTPKKGTTVIFDGSIYHASSSPTKNKRCIFNFCYSKE